MPIPAKSIGMGMVIEIIKIEVGGRRMVRESERVRIRVREVEGMSLREAEEGAEAESDATKLMEREGAEQIEELLTAQRLLNASKPLPCFR